LQRRILFAGFSALAGAPFLFWHDFFTVMLCLRIFRQQLENLIVCGDAIRSCRSVRHKEMFIENIARASTAPSSRGALPPNCAGTQ
jgi:hypothetical protein